MNNRWIIIDWDGSRMFPDKTFTSFKDAWDFVYANIPKEDWQYITVEIDVS